MEIIPPVKTRKTINLSNLRNNLFEIAAKDVVDKMKIPRNKSLENLNKKSSEEQKIQTDKKDQI